MKATAYNEVAARMRKRILAGRWTSGMRLAGERELCEEFRISRITVRHALRLLAEEGLIYKRHGSGNYVAAKGARRIPVMIDYTGSMRNHAPNLKRRVVESGWQAAPEAQASELRIAAGEPVLTATRVDSLEGVPLAWDQLFIPRRFAAGLNQKRLARVDFLERWAGGADFKVHHCQQTVEAIAADDMTARWLELPRGAPVLKATEMFYASVVQPAGLFVTCYHPQHICIRSSIRWQTT